MKRAFLREAEFASSHLLAAGSEVEQPKQGSTGGNRRARTSAAMIGLALSMGASGALLPRHGDGAIAAESKSTESAIAALPQDFGTSASSADRHIVREGQTLWQIAQEYRVNVEELAVANRVPTDAVLRVGQVLTVPDASHAESAASISQPTFLAEVPEAVANRPGVGGALPAFDAAADARLKADQDLALTRLRQKQSELSQSLVRLEGESTVALAGSSTASSQPTTDVKVSKLAASTDKTAPEANAIGTQGVEASGVHLPTTAATVHGGTALQPLAPSTDRVAEVAPEESINAPIHRAAFEIPRTSDLSSARVRTSAEAEATTTSTVEEPTAEQGVVRSEQTAVEQEMGSVPAGLQNAPAAASVQIAATTPGQTEPENKAQAAAVVPQEETQASSTVTLGNLPSPLQTAVPVGSDTESQFSTIPPLQPLAQPEQQRLASAGVSTQTGSEASSGVALNTLQVPVLQPETGSSSAAYQIKPGDTLSAIARAHGVSRDELVRANNIRNPNVILAGATLTIPRSQSATATNQPLADTRSSQPIAVASSNLAASGSLDSKSNQANLAVPTLMTTPGQVVVPTVPTLETSASDEEAKVTTLPSSEAEPFTSPFMAAPSEEETQVAVAPFAGTQSATQTNLSPYAANLLTEIRELRAQRRAARTEQPAAMSDLATTEGTQVAVASVGESANAESMPSLYLSPTLIPGRELEIAALDARPASPAPEQSSEAEVAPVSATPSPRPQVPAEPQLVAAAPLGSESYAPLAEPLTGRFVSPDLPVLPAADQFLPESDISQGFIWPAQGVLTSGYGWRWGRMHRGIDVAAPVGTPVVASASGVVVSSGWNSGGYGNLVEIRHSDGTLTRYAHNNRLLVRAGEQVRQGQQIAEMGSTGYSTGPHVHFEVHPPNQGAVNPMAYLPSR